MDNPDFLIVGGGSAGAVLAARLSEDPATRVLLIEAGPDTAPDAVPADIADTFPSSSLNSDYFWPQLEAVRSAGSPLRPFPQARVMGGGSTVMGLWALRGLPSDYDAWAQAGATGWSWQDVLPVFRRLEKDADRDSSQAPAGTYPVRRLPHEEWPGFVQAIERAAVARGVPLVGDINERPGEGFFPMPLSQDDAGRASSARVYLTDAVRRRPNLAIMSATTVSKLALDGARVTGVIAQRAGETLRIAARATILCAGAIHSPAIMLRSGIGPADALRLLGIAPAVDRASVGRNLQNHPYLHLALTLPRRSRLAGHLRRFAIAGLRLSSGASGCPDADLLLFMIGRVSPRAYGPDVAMIGAALYSPFSRGEVTLQSADAAVPPRIEFRMFDDPRDGPRMIKAARFAESLLLTPGVAASYHDCFLLPPVMALHQFNRPGLAGALLAAAAKMVLNAPPAASRAVLGRVLRPGRWLANARAHAPLQDAEILAAAAPMAHPIGTCAMGGADNPSAVVDPACRVYGVSNLRVADASIMPRIPSANTNLPTIMIAEKAAALIRAGR
jgi:5-(hydroxymethyl)furfural/furfural oxidase